MHANDAGPQLVTCWTRHVALGDEGCSGRSSFFINPRRPLNTVIKSSFLCHTVSTSFCERKKKRKITKFSHSQPCHAQTQTPRRTNEHHSERRDRSFRKNPARKEKKQSSRSFNAVWTNNKPRGSAALRRRTITRTSVLGPTNLLFFSIIDLCSWFDDLPTPSSLSSPKFSRGSIFFPLLFFHGEKEEGEGEGEGVGKGRRWAGLNPLFFHNTLPPSHSLIPTYTHMYCNDSCHEIVLNDV